MKHLINIEVQSVKGIAVYDKDMKPDDFASIQISCVVGIGRKKEFNKSGPSFPIRKTKAKWSKEKDAVTESSMLSIETSLNNKRKKTFEVSILLVRGNEQILIGIASLIFVSALLETEIEIPINRLGTKRALEIKNEAKTLKKKGSVGKQSNADAAQTVSFNGSDRGRIYSLQESASIKLKCVCLPRQYEDIFMHVEGMLHQKTEFGANPTPMVSLSPSPASFNLSSHFQANQDPPSEQNIQSEQLDNTSAQMHSFFGTKPMSNNMPKELAFNYLATLKDIPPPLTHQNNNTDQHYHSSPHDCPHACALEKNLLVPYLEELPVLYNDLRTKLTRMNKYSMILLGNQARYIANSKIGLSLRKRLVETTNQFLSINKLGIRGFDPYVPNLDFERTQPFLLTPRSEIDNDLQRIQDFDFSAKANSAPPPPVDGYTTFTEYPERRIAEKNNDTALHQASLEFSEHIELDSHVSNETSILTDPFPLMEISLSQEEMRDDYDTYDEGDFAPTDQFPPIGTIRNDAYMYDEKRDYGPTRKVISADTVSGTTRSDAYMHDEKRDYGPTRKVMSADTELGTLEGGVRLSYETLSELSDILGPLDDEDNDHFYDEEEDDHFYDQSFNDEDDLDGSCHDSFESVLSMESTFTRSSF